MGLPAQTYKQVGETIKYVEKAGALPYLSEYSPLPHTQMWEEAVEVSRFNVRDEPLFHNNTLFPCWDGKDLDTINTLKNMAQDVRKKAL